MSTVRTHAHSFTTAKVPPRERSLLFQQEMDATFSVGLAVEPTGPEPLTADVVGYCGRSLNFAALRFSPHVTTSTPVQRTKRQRLLATVQKEGEAFVSQGGRESHVIAGSLFLVDLARPFHIETGEICTHSIYLPYETMRSLLPQIDGMTGVAIDATSGASAVFRTLVNELVEQAPRLDEESADRMADAIPHVLAAALGTRAERERILPSVLHAEHMQRLRRFIRRHLSDSSLDVETISDGVSLSPRYVHRLFAEEGTTCMRWVWGERLDRCKKELLEPSLESRSIGEIAYGWGFNDLAHFSRSFRERFGLSARDLRRSARPPR